MKVRRLGRTGLEVSEIALGTVALGTDYGIRDAGGTEPPTAAEAARLIRAAVDGGINLFDTAPRYGEAEERLGLALQGRDHCIIATKVDAASDPAAIRASLNESRRRLRREVLDIVQIHNARARDLQEGPLLATLREARDAGILRFLGASVYTPAAALSAVQCGDIDVIQVLCNVLDRRFLADAVPAARAADVGVIARSILLKGALTSKAKVLPPPLQALRAAAAHAAKLAHCSWEELPAIAIRYCLGVEGLSTLLLGARTAAELEVSLMAAAQGTLAPRQGDALDTLPSLEETLLDPSTWGEAAD